MHAIVLVTGLQNTGGVNSLSCVTWTIEVATGVADTVIQGEIGGSSEFD